VLSHAHIDHSGYLPLLARQGFHGPIYCTSGTADLLDIVLPDAARLQEEEAERANRKGYSKHKPALPLYTLQDAHAALALVERCRYERVFAVTAGISALLRGAQAIATTDCDRSASRATGSTAAATGAGITSSDVGS
jgi:metallo-beta-lactamase family protein